MAATLAVTPALAVETLTFDLSVDDANILQVSTGDIITVTFRIRSEGGCSLSTMQNEAEYDSRFFELEDSSPAVTEIGMAVGDTRTTGQRIVKYSMLADEEMALSDNAEFGSFRLRVIAVRGTTTVRNSESYAYNKSGAYAVSKSDLTVSIAGHPENPVQYTVRYHANGGDGSMPDQIFWEDESQNLSQNAFTRNGYSFDGWAESENGEVTYRDGQSVLNLTDHDGAVANLYAVWKARGRASPFLTAKRASLSPTRLLPPGAEIMSTRRQPTTALPVCIASMKSRLDCITSLRNADGRLSADWNRLTIPRPLR